MSVPLRSPDLCFINRVASLRFAGAEPAAVEERALETAIAGADGPTPFLRAATLAAVILRDRVFGTAPLQTALLTLHCALAMEGFSLLAPQGVVAGMIRDLASRGDAGTVARWLEDRAVPTSG